MLQKNGNLIATGDCTYGLLNGGIFCITVYRKIVAAPIHIVSSFNIGSFMCEQLF